MIADSRFPERPFRSSLFLALKLSKLKTMIFNCSLIDVALNPLPCSRLQFYQILLPYCRNEHLFFDGMDEMDL